MKTLDRIRQEVKALADRQDELRAKAEEGTATDEDLAEFKANKESLETKMSQRDMLEKDQENDEPEAHIEVIGPAAEQHPYALGQYLQDITKQAKTGSPVPRVVNYQQKVRAATGSSEAVPSDGGFLVGTEMSDEIVKRIYNNTELISRADKRTLTGNVNGIKMNGIDETSRADGSRHGGVRAYWVAEGGDTTASKPKFRQMEFDLHKLAALYYATDEVLQDASVLQQEVEIAVSDELSFKIQDAIVNGSGAGKPLGILTSDCLVSQAKESGQAAATIVYENILKMLSRAWGKNLIWIANQEIIPQLGLLAIPVGTGGMPLYLPGNDTVGRSFDTLWNRPIVFIEQAAALGTAGDLILADMSQYRIIDKGGVQMAMSIHVEFVADEVVFRWITRIDGQPIWNSALTPYKGSATRSPFVALAARS